MLRAAPLLAKRLVKNFPGSLDGAPAILPVSEMALRRQLDTGSTRTGLTLELLQRLKIQRY